MVKGFRTKPGIGKTGVHLRYHEKHEYQKLTKAQRLELKQWREEKKEKSGDPPKKKPKGGMGKKEIAALSKAVAKHLADQQKEKDDDDNIDAIIMSLQSSNIAAKEKEKPTPKASTEVNTSALKSILHRVKN